MHPLLMQILRGLVLELDGHDSALARSTEPKEAPVGEQVPPSRGADLPFARAAKRHLLQYKTGLEPVDAARVTVTVERPPSDDRQVGAENMSAGTANPDPSTRTVLVDIGRMHAGEPAASASLAATVAGLVRPLEVELAAQKSIRHRAAFVGRSGPNRAARMVHR